MGSPQQISSPPPASFTTTTLPQISHLKTCPSFATFTISSPSVVWEFLAVNTREACETGISDGVQHQYSSGGTLAQRKNVELQVAFAAFWRVFRIFRGLDIRSDMSHREALVLFAGTGRAFAQILFALVKGQLFSAVNTHIFAGADFLSCTVALLFGHV
jgi:hypothetical protein